MSLRLKLRLLPPPERRGVDLGEARQRARITAYTFEGGVEHRYAAFPLAQMTVSMHDMREAFVRFGRAAAAMGVRAPVTMAQIEEMRGGFSRKENP